MRPAAGRAPRHRPPGQRADRAVRSNRGAGAPARSSHPAGRCRGRCRRRPASPSAPIQVTFATPPMFSTASGFASVARQCGMIHRRQRRPLAAGRDVGRAEVVGDGHAGAPGQFAGVADLPGPPPVRLVQDGLAVEADQVRLPRPSAATARRPPRMALGQPRRRARQARSSGSSVGREVQDPPQVARAAGLVGQGQRRAERADPLAVGLQPGGIDAVQRGPAHQPDRAQHFPSSRVCASPSESPDAMVNSDFLQEATERGFVFQCTDIEGLDAALRAGTVTAYIGFDCTARQPACRQPGADHDPPPVQRHGHRPLVLMGGGTTRIGDPSGKDESRQLLTDEQIAANMAGIRRCFDPFLRFGDGPSDAIMANNDDWLSALGYIPLLREVGTHFTVNRMLSFDSVRLRLDREQPLTFLEFNYMILQSYDFRELNRRYGVSAADRRLRPVGQHRLRHRADRGAPTTTVFGLTTPLITTASGAKMGKTAQGAVWLTRSAVALRLLAVLAQHRGCRCRPVPAPVHRPAAGRDRPAGGARRGRDQRGEEGAGDRGDRLPHGAPRPRRPRPRGWRSRKARRRTRCRASPPPCRPGCWTCCWPPISSRARARPGGWWHNPASG